MSFAFNIANILTNSPEILAIIGFSLILYSITLLFFINKFVKKVKIKPTFRKKLSNNIDYQP